MEYELKRLRLIAEGGQAEIYDIGDNKILRVLKDPGYEKMLRIEMQIMKVLKDKGICIPEVYEYLNVDGRPAIIIEKITGESMLQSIAQHPLNTLKEAQMLANLHIKLSKSYTADNLNYVKDNSRYLIGNSTSIDSQLKQFAIKLLDELPEGEDLCHGDFHPGNILKSGGKYYIIDWSGSYRGDILSDAAHTYILLKSVPDFQGMNAAKHALLKLAGSIIAEEYVKTFRKSINFDWSDFSKWMVIKAAERTFYGFSSEQDALIRFIRYCYDKWNNGESADYWYREM